jgi:hypothetical protein
MKKQEKQPIQASIQHPHFCVLEQKQKERVTSYNYTNVILHDTSNYSLSYHI